MATPLPGFFVQLRREVGGEVLCEEAVEGRDLADAMAELAFDAGLRSSGLPIAVSDLEAKVAPVYRKAGAPCLGFTLETEAAEGRKARAVFGREILEPVAMRASRRLVSEGRLERDSLFYYSIELEQSTLEPLAVEGATPMPAIDPLAIRPFLDRASLVTADATQGEADEAYARETVGEKSRETISDPSSRPSESANQPAPETTGLETKDAYRGDPKRSTHYSVFYTASALAKAERVSRKGASHNPPVETGGLLLFRLHWCPDERQLFGIVDDVLEATHSAGTTYSLTFTEETWARVQAVLRARQKNPMTRGERLGGSCHGHNFLPFSEGETCDGCPAQGVCQLTTAYLSMSDRVWSRAVFPREPWQIAHVFGLTPRREATSALYGQRGGRLERRDYYVLEDDFANT